MMGVILLSRHELDKPGRIKKVLWFCVGIAGYVLLGMFVLSLFSQYI